MRLHVIDEKVLVIQRGIDLLQNKVDLGLTNKEGAPSYATIIEDETLKKHALLEYRKSIEQEQ